MADLFALVFCFAMLIPGSQAPAQEALRAAAVVNDQVVSMLDLVMRTRLAILGARIEDTPQVRRRIARQVLIRLIDENLQMQEAERLAIEVPEEQIDLALAQIAQQNGMKRDAFVQTLRENAVLPFAIRNQIKAELAWRAVLELRIRPSINIDEDEIDAAVEQITAQGDAFDRRVAEIVLAVPDARQESQVLEDAQRIIDELNAGANFFGLAREFSQSSSANLGGDLGWIGLGELDPALANELKKLQAGQISPPIRTATGFTILYLSEARQRSDETVDRAAIAESLVQQRLELLAQRTLQELRRTANIDIRI
jgi:peptidyl-prolyl cis-trans isomerase SurA